MLVRGSSENPWEAAWKLRSIGEPRRFASWWNRFFSTGRAGGENTALVEQAEDGFEEDGAKEGGTGDGEDPGVDDAPGNTPADGGEATSSADADDGAGNGVGGADGNAEDGVGDNGQPAGSFRGEATEGNELGDALAHGLDDAPSASHGAAPHS